VEHHAYIPESSLPVSEAKSWRPEISISTGTNEAPLTMTEALTVSGTVWKGGGLAIQLKYCLFLLELKIKNPIICEL